MPRTVKCEAKDYRQLSKEWDALALERDRQIADGHDLSFTHVLVPTALKLLTGADLRNVLDVGAGVGEFTRELSTLSDHVTAIEPSRESIRIAKRNCSSAPNVTFVANTLEGATNNLRNQKGTASTAVMTLMSVPDLDLFAERLAAVLQRGAPFVAIITHPWFWPRYWGYDECKWFRYSDEIYIEAPFSISLRKTDIRTTHIHRPLETYLRSFKKHGFALDEAVEPIPSLALQKRYPSQWKYPRFLGLRWKMES